MENDPTGPSPGNDEEFARVVGAKAARKLRVLRGGQQGVWFGLGMFGLIGWSVAVPTVAGCLLGLWWDRRHPGGHSLTLVLMAAGLCIGCANAWHWIAMEDKAIRGEPGEKNE